MTWYDAFGYFGALIGIVVVVPQLFKLSKDKNSQGVSFTSWLLITVASICWLTYGILIVSWPQIVANTFIALGSIWLTIVIGTTQQRFSRITTSDIIYTLVAVIIWVTATFFLPEQTIGWLGGALTLISRIPQLKTSYHTWKQSLPSEVSIPTIILWIISPTAWILYGIGAHDVVVSVINIIFASANICIVFWEISARRHYEHNTTSTVNAT